VSTRLDDSAASFFTFKRTLKEVLVLRLCAKQHARTDSFCVIPCCVVDHTGPLPVDLGGATFYAPNILTNDPKGE
jgi:hypothetical protein